MSVCGIDNDHVYMGINQSLHTLQNVCCDTYGSTAQQTSLLVLCGQRIFDVLLDILDRDQTSQIEIIIHDRQFFFSGFCQDLFCFLQRHAYLCGNQSFAGHGFLNLLCEICLEFQVTVCNNTNQFCALCDWYTGDTEFCHQIVGIRQSMLRR